VRLKKFLFFLPHFIFSYCTLFLRKNDVFSAYGNLPSSRQAVTPFHVFGKFGAIDQADYLAVDDLPD